MSRPDERIRSTQIADAGAGRHNPSASMLTSAFDLNHS